MPASQHQIPNEALSVAIRGRLSAALERMRDLHRGPTDRELAEELSALQYRGSRWGRRLQRIEQQGLLTLSARGLHAPRRLLEDVVLEFDDECLDRGIILEDVSESNAAPMWVDAEQLIEALRCVLESCISQAKDGARIRLFLEEEGACCCFTVDACGVLPHFDDLTGYTIHQILAGAGGHARVITSVDRLTVSLRLPRELKAEELQSMGVQAA